MQPTPENQDRDSLILLLSERERICLDAYLFNESNKIEAFKVFKGITDTTIDEATLNSRANSWLNNRTSKAYLIKYRDALSRSETLNSQESENADMDKSAIIAEMTRLMGIVNDPKLKAELLMKLNDLKGYKKDTTKQDEQQIRFYLPQRCDTCDYKAEYQSHNKSSE